MFWRYLRAYLQIQHDIHIRTMKCPEQTFQKAFEVGFFSAGDVVTCLQIRADRQKTFNGFIDKIADELFAKAPQNHKIMENYIEKIEVEL